jgi:hypothetical protein
MQILRARRPPSFESDTPAVRINWHARYLDSLCKSTVLALASMIPALPGIMAACGAVAYDFSQRLWIGGILSGLSMIPLAGYLPGAGKIWWNLMLIGAELRAVEDLLLETNPSPELAAPLVAVIRTYFDRIAKINPSLPLVKRLQAILNREAPKASVASD